MSSLIIRKAAQIIAEVSPKLYRIHGVESRVDSIRTSDTMTRALGTASRSYVITLNSKAFSGHEDSDSFAQTIIHELCHLYELQPFSVLHYPVKEVAMGNPQLFPIGCHVNAFFYYLDVSK